MEYSKDLLKKRFKLSPTQTLVISIIALIIIGGILLKLPISNQAGKSIELVDSFFVATSAVCITGLTPVVLAEQFSFFGQIIILILIQIGGLRIYNILCIVVNCIKKKNTFVR